MDKQIKVSIDGKEFQIAFNGSADDLKKVIELGVDAFEAEKKGLPSREQITGMFADYVSNDYEAAEENYVQELLENVGCDKEMAEAIGLGYIFEDVDEDDEDEEDY